MLVDNHSVSKQNAKYQKVIPMNPKNSNVEKTFLAGMDLKMIYPPTEKMPVITVDSFPALGKLAALRFLEWTQSNPEGLACLATGKTPEYFIKWVQHFTANWDKKETSSQLEQFGIDINKKPDFKGLYFVQMDEFYPIESSQHNSFNHYVKNFYVKGFNFSSDRCLLIDSSKIGLAANETLTDYWPDSKVDLSLRFREPESRLETKQAKLLSRIDQWCMEYENKIRSLGGIGFFLGGIGPDGHIGFNVKGSDHNSTTRLCATNYETQAAAAGDLGGIEISRNRLVITIGLSTITYNPDCVAVIMAAGAAKAKVVEDAIQSEVTVDVPATALRKLSNARFYITEGASDNLIQRYIEQLKNKKELTIEDVDKIVINLSSDKGKRISQLDKDDFKSVPYGNEFIKRYSLNKAKQTEDRILSRIDTGIEVLEHKRFLHTEPHHDDVMLGCLPGLVRNFRQASNVHDFVTLTSGFTSVTNAFFISRLKELSDYIETDKFKALFKEGYFTPGDIINKNRDIWQYLDGVAGDDIDIKTEGQARRLCRDILEVYNLDNIKDLKDKVNEFIKLIGSQYPGQKADNYIQKLKGMCREWESECLWGYYGWRCQSVHHLRLGFYTGDIFTQEPTFDRDVKPVLDIIEKTNPDIVTVALDPEASGPDTHYKVLQAVAEALHVYQQNTGRTDIQIWGYRNVWYRFGPWEADMYVPVSLNMFSVMDEAFNNCFASQRHASFPSYELDGPFSLLAQKIQAHQYQKLKTCLGREWFNSHQSPLIRATRGFVFLKVMTTEQLFQTCRRLKKHMEGDIR